VFKKIQSEMLRNDKNLVDFENGISRFISQFNVSIQNREGDGDDERESGKKEKLSAAGEAEEQQEKLCMSHFLVDLLSGIVAGHLLGLWQSSHDGLEQQHHMDR
jgi:hypothetical protein